MNAGSVFCNQRLSMMNQPPFVRPRICRRHARLFSIRFRATRHAEYLATITHQLHPRNLPAVPTNRRIQSFGPWLHPCRQSISNPFSNPFGFCNPFNTLESSFQFKRNLNCQGWIEERLRDACTQPQWPCKRFGTFVTLLLNKAAGACTGNLLERMTILPDSKHGRPHHCTDLLRHTTPNHLPQFRNFKVCFYEITSLEEI